MVSLMCLFGFLVGSPFSDSTIQSSAFGLICGRSGRFILEVHTDYSYAASRVLYWTETVQVPEKKPRISVNLITGIRGSAFSPP